jgi:O-acetyl-ADP-ribose deacetylase (regulator of RNase III)
MPVIETAGNLFESEAEALINPVNCAGVMGAGLALKFRRAYPAMYYAYRKFCKEEGLQPGGLFVWKDRRPDPPGETRPIIINFPTKRHWRDAARIEYIQLGLPVLVAELATRKIASVATPALGCGLGGLNYTTVRSLIFRAFREAPEITCLLYRPE